MTRIDTTAIEGYDTMSAEEKVKALEDFEFEDASGELKKYKDSVTRANKEAAEWKKKHNELLSEDEKEKQATEERMKELEAKCADFEKRENTAKNKSHLLALGYDETLADETATAITDGDMAKVFENQKKFLETHDKAFKAELLKQTPTPPAGDGSSVMTLSNLKKMSPEERFKFSEEHPEEYKTLYGG